MHTLAPSALPKNVTHATNHVNTASISGVRKDFLKNLDCEVGLSPEQRVRIEKILADGQECTKQIWDKIAPQVHSEWKCVKENIRAELTDEQKPKFDEFMKRSRKDDRKPDERKAQPARVDFLQDDTHFLPPNN